MRLLLVIFGVLLACSILLAGEMGLRHLCDFDCLNTTVDNPRTPYRHSASLGWRHQPGFKGPAERTEVHINEAGYRGPHYAEPPAPGKTRIVMLGDSLTFGYGLPEEEIFSVRLEKESEDYEVVNLAVSGYGVSQSLLLLDEALSYRPDWVILNVCLENDWWNDAPPRPGERTNKPYFVLENGTLKVVNDHLKLSTLDRLILWFKRHSLLFSTITDPGDLHVRHFNPKPGDYDMTILLIKQMAEVLRERGVKFLVLAYPYEYEGVVRPDAEVAEYLMTELDDVAVVNLYDEFVKRGVKNWRPEVLSEDLVHLSSQGHRHTAHIIQDLLSNENELKESSSTSP